MIHFVSADGPVQQKTNRGDSQQLSQAYAIELLLCDVHIQSSAEQLQELVHYEGGKEGLPCYIWRDGVCQIGDFEIGRIQAMHAEHLQGLREEEQYHPFLY